MAVNEGPFATYTSVEIASAAAQTEVIANVNAFKALISDPSVSAEGTAPSSPDFGDMPPATADKLRTEIVALVAAIEAMPTS